MNGLQVQMGEPGAKAWWVETRGPWTVQKYRYLTLSQLEGRMGCAVDRPSGDCGLPFRKARGSQAHTRPGQRPVRTVADKEMRFFSLYLASFVENMTANA